MSINVPAKLVLLLFIGGLALFWTQSADSMQTSENQAKPSDSLPTPILNTHDLMEAFNQPYYRSLKQEMSEEAQTEKKWESIAQRGLQAAEIANLVAIRDTDHDEKKWRQYSVDLQEAGKRLSQAAKSRDFAATSEAYRGLLQSCNQCHTELAGPHAPRIQP